MYRDDFLIDLDNPQYLYDENYPTFVELYEIQKYATKKYLAHKQKMDFAHDMALDLEESHPKCDILGERIKAILDVRDIDIVHFCDAVQISRASMHRYIKGTHVPPKKTLLKIIRKLGVSVQDFSEYPDDFALWRLQCVPRRTQMDIWGLCAKFLGDIDLHELYYTTDDHKKRMLSAQQVKAFRSLIDSAVSMLRLMTAEKKGEDKPEIQG